MEPGSYENLPGSNSMTITDYQEVPTTIYGMDVTTRSSLVKAVAPPKAALKLYPMSVIPVTACPMSGLALYFTPTYTTRSAAPEVKLTVTLPFAITAVPKVGDNLTQFGSYSVTEGSIAGK